MTPAPIWVYFVFSSSNKHNPFWPQLINLNLKRLNLRKNDVKKNFFWLLLSFDIIVGAVTNQHRRLRMVSGEHPLDRKC